MLIDYINHTKLENQIRSEVEDAICEVAENINIREYISHEDIINKVSTALEDEITDIIDDMVDTVIDDI